ncbi:hypothetical protein NPIL_417601 [Nephila pilipes]|uniref:Uncharacterized protein n=1 Tax=Nephila pilipes TaxID=299642 RepID=A0A8X6N7T9_NEPPI|nr:hypothetical protein NPIL_417601 [Nephila pilipes]
MQKLPSISKSAPQQTKTLTSWAHTDVRNRITLLKAECRTPSLESAKTGEPERKTKQKHAASPQYERGNKVSKKTKVFLNNRGPNSLVHFFWSSDSREVDKPPPIHPEWRKKAIKQRGAKKILMRINGKDLLTHLPDRSF